jgi:hypothetical protein
VPACHVRVRSVRSWLLVTAVVGLALALAPGGGVAAEAGCTPGAAPSHDPIAGTPHPPDTAGPVVIGCWRLQDGPVEVHGRRMRVGDGEPLCLGTPNKVVCMSRWPPPSGRAIAGTSCGGGDGFIYVEGTVSARVRRVYAIFKDASGRKRSRRASVVWLRGEVAETLRVKKPFGYYHGETVKGAQMIETIARDADGRVIGRAKQTGCNRPR